MRRARRGPDLGEQGFALMAVLAVIALTSIMIAALFGMLLTTIRVTERQERTAREARAADGAVTAAINHLRLEQVAGSSNACQPVFPALTSTFTVPFDRIDGAGDVSVTCTPAADSLGPSGGDMSLVGTGYAGGITNWKTAWPWASIGAGGAVSGTSPTLIHSGGEELKFNGNVNSANGAAAIRNPTSGSPAVSVRGAYRQPLFGLGSTTDCGLLDDAGPTEIRTVGDRLCDPSVVVPDPEPISNLITPPPLAAMPASCSGAVVTFAPGYYDQASVRTLNSWFRGGAGCTGKTFYFPPGSYWFDANDSAAPAADRHALILDNPSSNFVFGEPKGWSTGTGAAAANFPSACSSRTGVANASPTIVLSGRTAFRHVAGRLAVCPDIAADGTLTPAMAQQSTAPNTVAVTNVVNVVAAGSGSGWTNPDNMRSGKATQPAGPAVFPCSLPAGGTTLVRCNSTNTFAMTLSSQAVGSIDSASLTVTGDEYLPSAPNLETVNGVDRRTATIKVVHSTGSCDAAVSNGSPDRARTMTYELVSGSCRTGGAGAVPITDGSQLNGATVQVAYTFRYAGICFFGTCPVPPQAMSIWDVHVRAGIRTMTTSPTAPPTGWDATPCGQPFCGQEPLQSVTRTFSLPGVSLAGASTPLQPSDPVQSAGVVIRQTGDAVRLFSSLPGALEVVLTTTDGTVCTTSTGSGVPNMAGVTYFAMVGDGLSACTGGASAADARDASWLEGATVSASLRMDCINPYGTGCGNPNDGSKLLSYVQPVKIDGVSVVATTDAYNGPVTVARLTVDSAGTTTAASANFFGPAILPNTALDVYWNGAASGASLFGGSVQLFSLGSEMAAGATADVVCCTRPETDMRKLRVTASIDGEKKLSVAVAIPTDPAREVEILDWTVCGRNGACV